MVICLGVGAGGAILGVGKGRDCLREFSDCRANLYVVWCHLLAFQGYQQSEVDHSSGLLGIPSQATDVRGAVALGWLGGYL